MKRWTHLSRAHLPNFWTTASAWMTSWLSHWRRENTEVDGMALLDGANTGAYGNPEITEVNIGVRNNPGILVSGHDLKDLERLLEQTKGTGVDVYTHSEMLPAHYYPAFKKYDNFVGNYGNAWWKQKEEFATFNGPILMTTNCIVPPADSYKERLWTTGAAGYPDAATSKASTEPSRTSLPSSNRLRLVHRRRKSKPEASSAVLRTSRYLRWRTRWLMQ